MYNASQLTDLHHRVGFRLFSVIYPNNKHLKIWLSKKYLLPNKAISKTKGPGSK